MYSIPYFKEKDPGIVMSFMKQHPFILLCGCDAAGKPVATQVPVLIKQRDEKLYLQGHIMKNTDHHKAFLQNPEALAVFTGPHTYVSASWYTNPHQGSTWNYMTVHAKGTVQFLAPAALPAVLKELTALFENNNDSPSLYEKLPDDYVARLINAIVAFEMEIRETDNVFKLSQNRDEASFHNIIQQLQQQNSDAREIAVEMQKRAAILFQTGITNA